MTSACPRAAAISRADGPYRRGYVCGIIPKMTETPESRAEPTTVTGQSSYDDRYERSGRLSQVSAWVGIIAGVVFVVAVIFFSGFFLGWSSGGHGGRDGRPAGQMGPGGMTGSCSMMGPGGMMGPTPSPTTTAPSTPHP